MSDLVEVTLTRTVKVPAKYAEIIVVIGTDEEWQKSADEMVKMIRIAAAKLGMEVDDFIAMALKEHAKEQHSKPVPAFDATSTTFISPEEIAKAETYFPG